MNHWSDCAVHNEPAFPKGRCDCGADIMDEARDFLEGLIGDCLDDLKEGKLSEAQFKDTLVEGILTLKGNHFVLSIVREGE